MISLLPSPLPPHLWSPCQPPPDPSSPTSAASFPRPASAPPLAGASQPAPSPSTTTRDSTAMASGGPRGRCCRTPSVPASSPSNVGWLLSGTSGASGFRSLCFGWMITLCVRLRLWRRKASVRCRYGSGKYLTCAGFWDEIYKIVFFLVMLFGGNNVDRILLSFEHFGAS